MFSKVCPTVLNKALPLYRPFESSFSRHPVLMQCCASALRCFALSCNTSTLETKLLQLLVIVCRDLFPVGGK